MKRQFASRFTEANRGRWIKCSDVDMTIGIRAGRRLLKQRWPSLAVAGFTLVELLVVIAIIGILVGLSVAGRHGGD